MTPTHVSRLTGPGRSAVAVIALVGPAASEMLGTCFQPATRTPMRPGQIRYGTWRAREQNASGAESGSTLATEVGESVVVTPIGDRHYEIHGHGGAAAVSRIIASLVEQGADEVSALQFAGHVSRFEVARSCALQISRAGSLGQIHEPLIAEAHQVLIACTTQRNSAIALQQARGALLQWTHEWLTRIESQLQNGCTETGAETLASVIASAGELLSRRRIGLHLATPYRVVLAGPPNVGKSSLVNGLVGFGRSITHDAAGTTRDVVDCDTVIAGLSIRIGDTAGIRTGGGVIEQEGIRRGAIAIAAADLVLLVVDPDTMGEHATLTQSVRAMNESVPVLKVLNKADLLSDACVVPDPGAANWLRTIASETYQPAHKPTHSGIDELSLAIAAALRPDSISSSDPVPITMRQVRWIESIVRSSELNAATLRDVADILERLRDGTEFTHTSAAK